MSETTNKIFTLKNSWCVREKKEHLELFLKMATSLSLSIGESCFFSSCALMELETRDKDLKLDCLERKAFQRKKVPHRQMSMKKLLHPRELHHPSVNVCTVAVWVEPRESRIGESS